MKTTLLLPILALGGLMLTGGAAVHAMPVTALKQAAPIAATQVYHRGRPHRRARITVYPRRYYGEPVPYFADYSYYYPAVRGFGDRNPVPRGNMRGCTVDLGYGRYESCDK
jgi:hypothetical protein